MLESIIHQAVDTNFLFFLPSRMLSDKVVVESSEMDSEMVEFVTSTAIKLSHEALEENVRSIVNRLS